MKIVVCIKQVPALDHMQFDRESKRLIREGVPNSINTFDRRAITEAVSLKEKFGGEVVVLTMGPPQAKDALTEALMMGCDRAVHLLGKEFAGADTLATARTLAMACRKLGFDLVLCGKYATDAETAQVPPMLAEFLDVPQVMGVTQLRVAADRKTLTAVRETDDGFETLECALPAVLSTGERLNKPTRVGPADAPKAEGKPFEAWSPHDMHPDMAQFGLSGSPTWVETIYSIEPARKHIMLDGGDLAQAAQRLVAHLKAEGWGAHEWPTKPHAHAIVKSRQPYPHGAKAIWVVAETTDPSTAHHQGRSGQAMRDVTLEMLGEGIKLANQINGELAAVLIGSQTNAHANNLAAHGADKVYVADAPALQPYMTEPYTTVLCAAIKQYQPFAVLFGSTANGRDLAPRVAARLGLGLTGDAIGVEIDAQGRLVMLKPAFGGNIVAPILSKTTPALVTIRPGMLQKPEPDPDHRTILVRLPLNDLSSRTCIVKHEVLTAEGIALDEAEVVVGVGAGIGGPENLPIVKAFADQIHASLAATRKVVDLGWMPSQTQVGLTGRAIAPRLYFTLGIAGQFNHNVGIQRAGIIVAVNNSPDAPIFKQADYGIVADWRAFVEVFGRLVT